MSKMDRRGSPAQGACPEPPAAEAPADSLLQADVFARLAVELHNAVGVEETVETVVHFALQALGCSHAGVALYTRGGQPEAPTVTDPVVAEIYQYQLDNQDGPMTLSMRERVPVLVRDTACDDRWPAWSARVRDLGVRSVLDIPLTLGSNSSTVGVLALYSRLPDGFSADDQAIAHILARHASIAVATARHEETMAAAIDARKLVGQAIGILMERFAVDADRAFAILRRYSQDTNTKLRDVAQQLIDTRNLPR